MDGTQISLESVPLKVSQGKLHDPKTSVSVGAQAKANAGLLVQILDGVRMGVLRRLVWSSMTRMNGTGWSTWVLKIDLLEFLPKVLWSSND